MASHRSVPGQPATAHPTNFDQERKSEFGAYFPQLFAFAYALTDDEHEARQIVSESFTRVLSRSARLNQEALPLALFGAARELCRKATASGMTAEDGLNSREREVLALIFDAELSREQIASLLHLKREAVASTLLRGLRKLRAAMTTAHVPAFYRLA